MLAALFDTVWTLSLAAFETLLPTLVDLTALPAPFVPTIVPSKGIGHPVGAAFCVAINHITGKRFSYGIAYVLSSFHWMKHHMFQWLIGLGRMCTVLNRVVNKKKTLVP